MRSSADVASGCLIEVFDKVPDYSSYVDPDAIRPGEDGYRVAVGRLAKYWGDQLLEIAEDPPTPITGHDVHTLDILVETISALITQLNDLDRARPLESGSARDEALRIADASILKGLEETARLMGELVGPRTVSLWVRHHAGPVYRRLRRLGRDFARRNQVLRARRAPWAADHPAVRLHP